MININEYLLSKKKKSIIVKPEKGCTVEDIMTWLEDMGVTDKRTFREYRFSSCIPNKGELLYICGPNESDDTPEQYWVILSSYTTQIVIKPKGTSHVNTLDTYKKTIVSFDKAIELALDMIKDPNKDFKL